NIELIAPTITLLLQWADEKDTNKKFRAIQGLGEVGVARPGWAYQAIEKLFKIVESDENAQGRYKAFTEISRIAKKEMSMVVEYVPSVITALKDSDKQIRRLAAWTLGQMAEVIPLEAKEAIPALTEALHDEYPLVRTFADKALNLIRKAMREEKTEDQQ
ncbi:MAG TPA: HEAT repeat domain-containing protein, partial [Candidatus Lokiarchaeia archaeon]|nr:HEAT repeat domain-containing protein [Candidatus Lokiarchaeia archaeon]